MKEDRGMKDCSTYSAPRRSLSQTQAGACMAYGRNQSLIWSQLLECLRLLFRQHLEEEKRHLESKVSVKRLLD